MPRSATGRVAGLLLMAIVLCICSALAQDAAQDRDSKETRREIRRLLKEIRTHEDFSNFDSVAILADSILIMDDDNPDAFYYRSLSMARLGDTAAAIESLSEGASEALRSSRVRILLARLCIHSERWTVALQALDEVLAFKPNEPEVLYLKGRALLSGPDADTAQALDALQRAIEIELEDEL